MCSDRSLVCQGLQVISNIPSTALDSVLLHRRVALRRAFRSSFPASQPISPLQPSRRSTRRAFCLEKWSGSSCTLRSTARSGALPSHLRERDGPDLSFFWGCQSVGPSLFCGFGEPRNSLLYTEERDFDRYMARSIPRPRTSIRQTKTAQRVAGYHF